MSDLQTPERGAEQASAELPIPKLETPSPVSSTSSVDTAAIVKQVAEELRKELKMAQSTKDKEIAKIKRKLGIDDLKELEERGATIPADVKLEYRLQQLEQGSSAEAPEQPKSSPGNGAELTATDVSEVIQSYQLDANDAQVLEKLRGTYRNRDHFQATMAEIALARATKSTPTPAASTTLTSSAGKTVINETQAEEKYGELGSLLKNPTMNAAKIKALTEELESAGYKL